MMDFGTAMSKVVHGGQLVARKAWAGRAIIRDGDLLRDMSGDKMKLYEPSQADMLAGDWGFARPAESPEELTLPFAGDAWPGAHPAPSVDDAVLTGGPNAPIAVVVPPGGFVSTTNDPHATENRDPDG